MHRRLAVAALIVTLFAGADWTQFRGADGTGISQETGLPTTWTATENVVWKTPLPGFGSSSPITLGNKIFLTAYSGYGLDPDAPGVQGQLVLHTLCVDRTSGKILWDKAVTPKLPETDYDGARVNLHGYASATPVTDGQSLYVFFGKTGVLKYDLDGNLLWQVSVGTEVDPHKWGSGASPILFEDLLIVNASAESQSIVALNKTTGKEVWRAEGIVDSWATPLIVTTAAGGKELVIVEKLQILGIDPATGEKLWNCSKSSDYICPSVIADGDVAYLINARFTAALFAVRTGGRGDVTDSHLLWTKKRWTTRVSTPIIHQGHLYGIDHLGQAHCLKLDDGETVYQERLDIDGDGDKIYASVVAADGKLYGVTRQGGTVVLALSPKFELLAHNDLGDPSVFNATPAVTDGQLLLRSDKFLYCIGK
ncbi:MAG TPA: PQQ-binding-like beta-propeller repeat protein [Thermoguttaceae bacterium]|nr:PQQ-binding-like beta-propeller repeat protein [Thermoguttaceae bacterium]